MVATIPYIQQKFNDFNRQYFNNQLPPVPVKLSNAKTFLGKVCFRKERKLFSRKWFYSDFVLRINTRIDLPEDVLEDTILHEMIHYHIAVNQLQDSSAHGRMFRAEMARLNAAGRHIRISHRLTPSQVRQAQGKRKTRVVCIAWFSDGRVGVKVVPKQVSHVLRFHREALRRFSIDRLEWYLSDDPFFARYPSSSALRFYLLTTASASSQNSSPLQTSAPLQTADSLQLVLQRSRLLLCDGTRLRMDPATPNPLLRW